MCFYVRTDKVVLVMSRRRMHLGVRGIDVGARTPQSARHLNVQGTDQHNPCVNPYGQNSSLIFLTMLGALVLLRIMMYM